MEQDGVPAAQLMTSDVITTTADTQVTDAVDTMIEHGIKSLLVVDEADELVGVITSDDFLELVSANDVDGSTVAEYMSGTVLTIGPSETIQTAAARMITNDISHLPVEDPEEGVVGMISTTDITAYSVSHV